MQGDTISTMFSETESVNVDDTAEFNQELRSLAAKKKLTYEVGNEGTEIHVVKNVAAK